MSQDIGLIAVELDLRFEREIAGDVIGIRLSVLIGSQHDRV